MWLGLVFLLSVCNGLELRIEPRQQYNALRLDLIPSNPSIHPETVKVIACGGSHGTSCKDNGMIRRILFSTRGHKNVSGRASLEDGGRILMINPVHIPTGTNQFIEVHSWLKNPDGTKASNTLCITTVNAVIEKTTKDVDPVMYSPTKKRTPLPWQAYTGIGLASVFVMVIGFMGLNYAFQRRANQKKQPEIIYGGKYNFEGDDKKTVMTRSDYEKMEDLKLADFIHF